MHGGITKAAALSVAAHAVILWASLANPVLVRRQPDPVRITILETPKKAETPAADSTATRATVSSKVTRKKAPVRQAPTAAAIGGYSDLFPSASVDDMAAARSTTVGSNASFDPETTAIPIETRTKNLPALEEFASELAQRISVPRAVRLLQRSGSVYVRFSREKDHWIVSRLTGDPYLRAIVWDVLDDLSPHSHPIQTLNASTYESVRIYVSFGLISSLDLSTQLVATSTDANKIFANFLYRDLDAKWQLAMPVDNEEGDDSVALDLIGVASFIYGKATETEPGEDPEVKRLKLSPAFVRPFGN